MADKKDEEKALDKRYEFLFKYLACSRKLKTDRWNKMMSSSEYKDVVSRFLDSPSETLLSFQLTGAGVLIPRCSIPRPMRGKLTYFVKRTRAQVTEANYRDLLIPGDLADSPIDELAVLVENAYVPILSNPKNHTDWPDVVRKDVKKHIYDFRTLIWQVKGKITGQSLLPMPMGIEDIFQEGMVDQNRVDSEKKIKLKSHIEEMVIKWAAQINEIVEEEATKTLPDDDYQLPNAQLEYWRKRMRNLESIYLQLKDPRVKRMDQLLESMNSPYSTYLKDLSKTVASNLIEARDISLYLKPLETYFDEFENLDMNDIQQKFRPLLHSVCLVWSHSKHYCKMDRIITLLRQISNMFISQASRDLSQTGLFDSDIEDTQAKLTQAQLFFDTYQEVFRTFHDKIEGYFRPPTEPIAWDFHEKMIFSRIWRFQTRLKELQTLFEVVQDYVKLERLEISGLKGKALAAMVTKIYEDFTKSYNEFRDVTYEVLEPEEATFTKDLKNFFLKVEEFDRTLAGVFDQVFSECNSIETMIRFIYMMGSIANRPIIMSQIWPHYEELIGKFIDHFNVVKTIFDNNFKHENHKKFLIVNQYLPPVAGQLCSLMKLTDSIDYPVETCKLIDHPLINSKMNREVRELYEELRGLIAEKEQEIFTAWTDEIPRICQTHLTKTLLRVTDEKLLESNFNPELITTLREIRYSILIHRKTLPQIALDLYSRSEFFFQSTYNLDLVVQWYNQIRQESSPVEFQLVEEEVRAIDDLIAKGQENYDWNSPEVPEYIEELLKLTRKLHCRVFRAQDNLKRILNRVYSWAMVPILQRKDLKDENLLSISDRSEKFQERYAEIEATALELDEVLRENYNLFFDLLPDEFYEQKEQDVTALPEEEGEQVGEEAPPIEEVVEDTEAPMEERVTSEVQVPDVDEELEALRREKWKPYLAYVDDLITKGLIQAASSSICYILDETDPEANISPLFEIQLCLEVPDITFRPSIELNALDGFFSFFENLLLDMMKMGIFISRVDPEIAMETENYAIDLAEDDDIAFMLEETCKRIKLGLIEAQQLPATFDMHAWLWLDDRQEYLSNFLRFARYLTIEERELVTQNVEYLADQLKPKKPELGDFQRDIDYFMELYKRCDKIESEKIICRWLRIDLKPFKQVLLNTICKWANLLKEYLVNRVITQLGDLDVFLKSAMQVFLQPVHEDDYDALLNTIYYLKEVRDRQFEIDDMFEPVKATIELLKQYQVSFDEDLYQSLVELPDNWSAVKKIAAQVKQVVAPLMNRQIELLHKKLNYYDFKQNRFLNEFYQHRVFGQDCRNPYEQLNEINKKLVTLEQEQEVLKVQTTIFEQEMPEYKLVKQARKGLKLLKIVWDYVNVIGTSLDEWKRTTWKRIDVEWMDQECKKLLRELRQLDRDTRGWELYTNIEAQIRNMMASLRAVSELQNPAIRDRHWQELMAETHVAFSMTDSTTLEDLLKLELHKYEEEVKNIVDKAVKEMAMEKVLKELHNTWNALEFDKEIHERTKLNILRINEETIEILEENQVQLQNMLGSKFVGYFLEEVTSWQQKLSNADAVINAWFEVQRAWAHLESIFIGSEDIRSQLPEDTRRFEKIDREFKELLKEMHASLNIVKATNRPKLLERLEELYAQLNICEKSLADYLETKRLAYPRFYFISSADLLDILSNGNNPELVSKHLSKLYDSLARLKWKLDPTGKSSKSAIAMIAKDGEEMKLHGICDCGGKVEVWLNHVTDAMKRTVRYHISQAVASYDEKPRDQWILDYQAQPALCGTQIWWTTEVNMAFMRLEEGFETALKDYQKKQINQLNVLIAILCGDLTESVRQKIMTICTIDVHARDVVAKLIASKVESATSFQWQSQLRHRWDDKVADCYGDICDASFAYSHEYLGNVPRLVITPLTDRCYITLTQSLHLIMGGAPAGPAGTGKTETTKDLGRALGQMVYVFNCSEQMDYKSCGNIYKGLAQVGAWGCFDEFNRISVEVLSVVAVQVKSVLDGIKSRKPKFLFFGEELNLVPTVGMFITMNPGYAGRTELPENLKTLFRPCAMVVPDFELICEIMLVAEGFQEARLLARKFITLYQLCRELLSKQDHYDWGLRAIKSVLVVAGTLKRSDPQRSEDQVLMRALRDFNTPKIVTDDTPVFMGLIGDLFPALDVPRKRDLDFEKMIKDAAIDLKLQPEDGFVLKVVQLEELLNVRHSVFIVGFAGTGKTQVWKALNRTYFNQKKKPHYNDLNPKAVTNDELFGVINPTTREWKDGLFSVIMRDQANMPGDAPKWIIFDGDIDPMWIESLNTVMDDNKVLTLASNERIALTKNMRLIFEISNLRTATPATVSRAGILYINPQDIGWNPFATSWIETRDQSERANLVILFDKYVGITMDAVKTRFKRITPMPDICHLEMLCNLLDCFLTHENVPPECPKEWYELYFVFACIWAFGSATFRDQLIDWRNEFSKWWQNEFKTVKFPAGGNVFNYFIENETKRLVPWSEIIQPFELDTDIPLQVC